MGKPWVTTMWKMIKRLENRYVTNDIHRFDLLLQLLWEIRLLLCERLVSNVADGRFAIALYFCVKQSDPSGYLQQALLYLCNYWLRNVKCFSNHLVSAGLAERKISPAGANGNRLQLRVIRIATVVLNIFFLLNWKTLFSLRTFWWSN